MSDGEDNPFEELDDAVGDREGDPFESLGEDSGESPEDSAEDGSDQARFDSPNESGSARREGPDTEQFREALDRQDPSSGTDGPVSEPDSSAEEFLPDAGRREGDPFDSFEDAFDEMQVDKLDPDVVWQELASAESRGSVGDAQKRTYAEVSKHSYCEGCEHFSPPPNISCGHEGTEIVEFLDMETVRLVDCPVVAEREKLEEDDGFGDA